MNLRRDLLAPCSLAFLLLVPSLGAAQDGAPAAASPRGSAQLDVSLFSASVGVIGGSDASTTVVAPVLRAHFDAMPTLRLLGVLPLAIAAFSSDGADSETRAPLGNPLLGAMYRLRLAANRTVGLGGGVALPLASVDDASVLGVLDAVAYYTVFGMHGATEPWLWAFDTLSLLAIATYDATTPTLRSSATAALAYLIDTGDDEERDAIATLRLSALLAYVMGSFEVGLSVAALMVLGGDAFADDDHFQSSIEPFVQQSFGDLFVRGAFRCNVDRPFGPSFDDGRPWALTLSVGAAF